MATGIRFALCGLLALAGWLVTISAVTAQTTVSTGHLDFLEVSYNGVDWSVLVQDLTTTSSYSPQNDGGSFRFDWADGIEFLLDTPGTTFTVPLVGDWSFTGAAPGQTVYGGVQNGSGATHMQLGFADGPDNIPGALLNDEATVTMTVLDGPTGGDVSIYRLDTPEFNSPFGDLANYELLISTAETDLEFTTELTHTDMNVLFSIPGNYRLQFVFSGRRASDGTFTQSSPYSYVFNVATVPEPATLGLFAIAGGTWAARRWWRRRQV